MKVPYAKKWQKETDKLRQIALDCDLTEELKWGKPCFTFLKKNVAIVIPLKESCAFSFFKGALLKDPKHILERIGEHTQAGRWIKFTSLREIAALRSTLKDYLYEAIELEESGKKVALKKPSEYATPEELQTRLDDDHRYKLAGPPAGVQACSDIAGQIFSWDPSLPNGLAKSYSLWLSWRLVANLGTEHGFSRPALVRTPRSSLGHGTSPFPNYRSGSSLS